jgi:hypothetical protein
MCPTFGQVYENIMKWSKHTQRSHKRCQMPNFWEFETMLILAHYSSLTHMNVKKLKLKIHLLQF